jgi:hypothetical protein
MLWVVEVTLEGQTITLYVAETQMAGETVKCVRIRNAKARAVTAAEDILNDAPDQAEEMQAAAPAVATNGSETREDYLDRRGRELMAELEGTGGLDEVSAKWEQGMAAARAEWDTAHPAA